MKYGYFNGTGVGILLAGIILLCAVTTNASVSLMMALVVFCQTVSVSVFARFIGRYLRGNAKQAAVLFFCSVLTALLSLIAYLLVPSLVRKAGIYLPLSAMNGTALCLWNAGASMRSVVKRSLSVGGFYSSFLLVFGIFREFIGNGTFFGLRILPQDAVILSFVLSSAGGLILLALIVALLFHEPNQKIWRTAGTEDEEEMMVSAMTLEPHDGAETEADV